MASSCSPAHDGRQSLTLRRFAPMAGGPRSNLRGTVLAHSLTVMLRISTRQESGREVVVLDGRVDAEMVSELERVIARVSGAVYLDLAGLKSVDEVGLAALRGLCAHGLAVIGASPYFRLLLELEKPGVAREPPPSRPRSCACGSSGDPACGGGAWRAGGGGTRGGGARGRALMLLLLCGRGIRIRRWGFTAM
jgi:hypothetical protein